MSSSSLTSVIIIMCISVCECGFAATPNADNTTLKRILAAMSPKMNGEALSATYVRKTYAPQTLEAHADKQERSLQRTTISELVSSDSGVRESVCDARDIGGDVKQYAFHYANNGERLQTYDSRSKRGNVRVSPSTRTNYLSLLTGPHAATNRGRFMSRAMPVLVGRLAGAMVASETTGTMGGRTTVTLEGEYKDSAPARYFTITVIPDSNYAVAQLREYDHKKRIVTDARATEHVNVSGTLWLAKSTWLHKYTYDDHDGNSVQCFESDILDPKIVSVDKNTFTLAFPKDAKIRDVSLDLDISKLQREAHGGGDAAVTTNVDGYFIPPGEGSIPSDKKGKAIVARARKAYAIEHRHTEACDHHRRPQASLELPRQGRSRFALTIPLACLVAAALLIGGRLHGRRAADRAGMTVQENGKRGDV